MGPIMYRKKLLQGCIGTRGHPETLLGYIQVKGLIFIVSHDNEHPFVPSAIITGTTPRNYSLMYYNLFNRFVCRSLHDVKAIDLGKCM